MAEAALQRRQIELRQEILRREIARRQSVTSVPVSPQEREQAELREDQRAMNDWRDQQIASGEITPEKSLTRQMYEELPQMIGGGVGGASGGFAGARAAARMPAAHPLAKGAMIVGGAALGAFGGGMGGKGYQQYYRQKKTGKIGTLRDMYTEQAIAGIEEGIGEVLGRGAGKAATKVGNKVISPLLRKTQLAPHAENMARILLRHGSRPSLAQITENRLIDTGEAMAEAALTGGPLQHLKTVAQPKAFVQEGTIVKKHFIPTRLGGASQETLDLAAKLGKNVPSDIQQLSPGWRNYLRTEQSAQNAAVRESTERIADRMSKSVTSKMGPTEVGNIVIDTLNQKQTAWKALKRGLYTQVDKMIQKSGGSPYMVDVTPLKKFVAKELKDIGGGPSTDSAKALYDMIDKMPGRVNWKQASSLKHNIGAYKRALGATKDVKTGAAQTLDKMMHGRMSDAAKRLNGKAYETWLLANEITKGGHEFFDKKLIKKLMTGLKDNPEQVVGQIFRPDAATQIKILKDAVTPDTWQALKHGYVEKLFKISSDVKNGTINGEKMLRHLDMLGEAMDAGFSKVEKKRLLDFAHAAMQAAQPTQAWSATGRFQMALAQGGIAQAALTGD